MRIKLGVVLLMSLWSHSIARASGAVDIDVFGPAAVRIIDTFKQAGAKTFPSGAGETLSIDNFWCTEATCLFWDSSGTEFQTDPLTTAALIEAVQWLDVVSIGCTLPVAPAKAHCYLMDVG